MPPDRRLVFFGSRRCLCQAGRCRDGAGSVRPHAGERHPLRPAVGPRRQRQQVLQARGDEPRRRAHAGGRGPAPAGDPGPRDVAHALGPEPAHPRLEEQAPPPRRGGLRQPAGQRRPPQRHRVPVCHGLARAVRASVHAAALRRDAAEGRQGRPGGLQRGAVRLLAPRHDQPGLGAVPADGRARAGSQREDLRHSHQGLHQHQKARGGSGALRVDAGCGHRAQPLRLPRRHPLLRQAQQI
mmetsp:Transcript_21525/g.57475  ORF Transcript_21525/g.57475 Transcript_21525/m.57475 type:complete len:240 (+) Transcript_21525:544-1263(+)